MEPDSRDPDPFTIASHPERTFDRSGEPSTSGSLRFVLQCEQTDCDAKETVNSILSDDRYTAGDWFNLPAPVYLVYDTEVGTVFKTIVTDGDVILEVLPRTEPRALADFHAILETLSGESWTVSKE